MLELSDQEKIQVTKKIMPCPVFFCCEYISAKMRVMFQVRLLYERRYNNISLWFYKQLVIL